MISLGSRDGRKGLGKGFSRNKREMDETELEEGEACSYHDNDASIDPDVALSYIDEKLQDVLGHFKKDFEGVVSAESLGAKFGIYGSFLPAHRRSPIWSQSKSPPRVQNHITQSPNTLQAEGGHHNSLAPASVSYSIKQGSASVGSASSYVHKPPLQNDLCKQNAKNNSIQYLEESTPKSVVRDQKTLKVRIKVGSDNLSVKKNSAIYSGLGLDGSPASSRDGSPLDSERLSCRLSFDGFESPTRILQMMTSSPLLGGCFLSPLPDNLICLSERPKDLQQTLVQPSSKTKPENSVIGLISSSVKDKEAVSGGNSMGLLDKKSSQDKKDVDRNISFDFQLKEIDDAVSCDELVSSALKLPLLSNVHSNRRDSPRASLKEKVSTDALKREPSKPVSGHASLSEKSNAMATSAGTVLHKKAADVRSGLITNLENSADQSETADSTTKISTGGSKFRNASRIGLKERKSTYSNDDMVLPSGKEQFSSGDEKKPKNYQVHDFPSNKRAMENNKDSAQVLKDRKSTDAEKNDCRVAMQKDSRRARGQYADFFGEIDEEECDIMDSPDLPSGEMLKSCEEVDKISVAHENISRVRAKSLETCKGTTLGSKSIGYSNDASVPENRHPTSEPVSINWVGCDKCQKWRIIPPGAKSDNLPDKWDCSMMTWLPNKNCCSTSEEETNNYHAPPPGMTSADTLGSAVAINGKNTGRVRKSSKSTSQNSPKKLPSSMKKRQQSAKEKISKEAKDSYVTNGLDLPQQAKSGNDVNLEAVQHKKKEKPRTDCYSDGGHAKISNVKSKRKTDQEVPKSYKKSKTSSMQTGHDQEAAHGQGIEVLGASSGYALAPGTAGNDQVSNSEFFASQNSKDDIDGIPPDSLGKSKYQVDALPAVSSVHVSKSSSKSKKRKADNFNDPPNSTPSGKLVDDSENFSRKRHRMSKSEGKDSSLCKRNSKSDKKSRSVSQHRLDGNESLQKDSSGLNPLVATTSSSSKVSGSLKVKSKFQELKSSPVESVSSSPSRILKSNKIPSGSKVIVMNDNFQDAVKLETSSSRRCSAADYDGNGEQSGAPRKDIISTSILHGSPNHNMIDLQDKRKEGLQLANGNGCTGNLDLDNGYPSEAQASHGSVNETTKGEVNLDNFMSSSGKSWQGSPSLSKEKNQFLKSNVVKGKLKMSENGNSMDHISLYEERERDKKINNDEKWGSSADKTENCTKFHSKEASLLKFEEREEFDERSTKEFGVEKSEDLVPLSAKEKSQHLSHSHGEKTKALNSMQPSQGNIASTSAGNARSDDHPRELKLNKKADVQNGTHIPSKHPISNGTRIKNQDAPSPLRRESSSQAASSAIKEATNLKHLADRLKSAGPAESTGMYFEAALKFLHGASLLESGKTENIKHVDIVQSMQIYSSTAKLCLFCAHEFEKLKDMAAAALAYKCVEVAYLRVLYSSHNAASRDRNELQTALQMIPPGESPSSSASDIDNLNNTANGDKAVQVRSGSSPQLTANLVIAARNRPNFSRLLSFAQDVNSAMEASRKSRVAFGAVNISMGQGVSKDGITSIKRALDFNFHDVDGLLRLVRLAKEAINR